MNYWILQCNPKKWRWFDAVRDYGDRPDTWGISLYFNEVKPGDIAFIWLSNHKGKKNRGIYAMAKITGFPDEKRKRFDWECQYWIDKEEMERLSSLPRLELQYIKFMIDRPLLVDDLEAIGLGHLLILRMRQRGIYKLTEEEGEKIKRMIEPR